MFLCVVFVVFFFFNLFCMLWKGEYMVQSQKVSPLVSKLLASSNLSSCTNEDKLRQCVFSLNNVLIQLIT